MASFALVSKVFYGCVALGAVVQAFLLYSAVSTIQMIATVQGCPLFVKRK
jgi:hypothetical protein